MKEMRSRWQEAPLLFAIFLDLTGFGITFPDVQLRAQEFGAPGWLIGTVLASYYLVQMVASPQWGRLSDRVGRKTVLALCSGLSALSMVCYALAHNVWWLFAARVLAGVGAANVVIAQAYIADTASETERPAALGRMGAAVSGGLVLGPVLGGFLATAGGNLLLGMVAACASALGTLWLLLALPAAKPSGPMESEKRETTRAFSLIQGNAPLLRLFLIAVTGWFALACLEGTFGRLLQDTLGMGRLEYGVLLGLEAGVAMVQGTLFPHIARRLDDDRLLSIAYLFQAVGLALMPFAPGFAILAVESVLFGLGVGLAGPAINTAASRLSSRERQGEIFGLLQSVRAFGFLVGPILGGALFDWRPAAPYLIAGGVMLAAAAAALVSPRFRSVC